MIGQPVLHYRNLDHHDAAVMGVVNIAEHTCLHCTVALMSLPPELSLVPDADHRFIHEAGATSTVDHTKICAIRDVAETGDSRLFIVGACYERGTLRLKIGRGTLSFADIVDSTL